MATDIPPWLPPTIGGLDIGLTCASFISMYLTFYWRGWIHDSASLLNKLGAFTSLASSGLNLIGMVFSSVNLIRKPQRQTLALRLMLSLILFPLTLTNFYNGCNTFMVDGPGEVSETPTEGRSRSWSRAAWVVALATILVTVIGAGVLCFVAAVLSLVRADKSLYWVAIAMWGTPLWFLLFERCCYKCFRSSRRSRRIAATSQRPKDQVIYRSVWAAGTMASCCYLLVFFSANWDERQDEITDQTEAWIQFAEALFGTGG